MTRRLNAGIAGRQLDLRSDRRQEFVLMRIKERPLRKHRDSIEAIFTRSFEWRLMLPAAAAADAEARHVVVIYPQHFLHRRRDRVVVAITAPDPRGRQDIEFVGGGGILGN